MTQLKTIVIVIVGCIALAGSFFQWYIRYEDTSQLLIGSAIGVLLLISAYLYHQSVKTRERDSQTQLVIAESIEPRLTKIERRLDDMQTLQETNQG